MRLALGVTTITDGPGQRDRSQNELDAARDQNRLVAKLAAQWRATL
jgi:hypothetical protein